MSEKWSDKRDILEENDVGVLTAILVDQQFNYWYDPCGKSGHEFDEVLTDVSKRVLRKLYLMAHEPEKLQHALSARRAVKNGR